MRRSETNPEDPMPTAPSITRIPDTIPGSAQYLVRGGDIAPEWKERAAREREGAWCRIIVRGDAPEERALVGYGGTVWPTAWPHLFAHQGSHGGRRPSHVITASGLAALAQADLAFAPGQATLGSKLETSVITCTSAEAAQQYPGSLTVGRTYVSLHDARAHADGMVRVVDDSGDHYLYPAAWFRATR